MSSRTRIVLIICAVIAAAALIAGVNIVFGPFGIVEGLRQMTYKESVRVPILMYHNFSESGAPEVTITADAFERHISALSDAGYTAVTFEQLCDYARDGALLPERPVVITIDDGYKSVYETAYPILEKYDMKATVFIIGVFHGEDLYKGNPYWQIIPHFGDAEAVEMASSGFLSIQSHSYDMHHYEPYEDDYREGSLRKRGENRADYIEAFESDFNKSASLIEPLTGEWPFVYSYPFGKHSRLSESLLKNMGVTVTVTTMSGVSVIARDVPQSLYRLKRLNVPGDMTAEELLEMIG